MRTIKIIFITACLALLANTGDAITPLGPAYTYQFTASPDFTSVYNGSTITLQGTTPTTDITLVDWNLLGWPGGPVTRANSEAIGQDFTFYDASTFYGSFSITGFEAGLLFAGTNTPGGGTLDLFADPPGRLDSGPWCA